MKYRKLFLPHTSTLLLPVFGISLMVSACSTKSAEKETTTTVSAELTLPEDMDMSSVDSTILAIHSAAKVGDSIYDAARWNAVFADYQGRAGVEVTDLSGSTIDPGDIEGCNEADKIGAITKLKRMTVTDMQLRQKLWSQLCSDSLDVAHQGIWTFRVKKGDDQSGNSTSLLLRNNADTTFITLMECQPLIEQIAISIDGKRHPELTTQQQAEAYLEKQGIKYFKASSSKYVETTNDKRVLKVRINYSTKESAH